MSTRVITKFSQHSILEQPGLRQVKSGAKWCREKAARATWEQRVLPDLVLAGAQRSGTTALTEALYRLPTVERPRLGKGSHYFSYNYYRGWEWFQSQFPTTTWANRVQEKNGAPLFTFDACPYYLFHPFAIQRMSQTLPDVKILIMLRDPVRRAESHYHHSVSHGHEEEEFAKALERESERLEGEVEKMSRDWSYWSHSHEHHSYASKGMYADQLERVFAVYPAEQVMVIQSEAFYRTPNEVLAGVTSWLDLPEVELTERDDRNSHEYQRMNEEMRSHLVQLYREPNERLYELLGETYDWLS